MFSPALAARTRDASAIREQKVHNFINEESYSLWYKKYMAESTAGHMQGIPVLGIGLQYPQVG